MTISVGDTLPAAKLMTLGASGPEEVSLGDRLGDGRAVVFAVPGAFTPTCSQAHMPSFARNMDRLQALGVDKVICVAVNDPFVAAAWAESTGATESGIEVLADPQGAFTEALGLAFTAPPFGLINRSMRYTMLVENGKVAFLNVEESPAVCELSSAETLLDHLSPQ